MCRMMCERFEEGEQPLPQLVERNNGICSPQSRGRRDQTLRGRREKTVQEYGGRDARVNALILPIGHARVLDFILCAYFDILPIEATREAPPAQRR
jgi:hypothetical protein